MTQFKELRAMAELVAESMVEVESARAAQTPAPKAQQDALVAAQKTMADVQASLRDLGRLLPKMPALPNVSKLYADDVADALRRAVRNRLMHAGSAIKQLGDPEQLAQQWASMLPLAPSPMEDLTGPFYDTAGLRSWLGITRQALDSRARNGTLLALTTGEGQRVYPAWQWRNDRTTIPHLAEVLQPLLAAARDTWIVALWMTAPVDHGDGREIAAWKWLDEGNDPEPVVSEARADAARWAA